MKEITAINQPKLKIYFKIFNIVGLEAYDDSSDEESEIDDKNDSVVSNNGIDSDEEIRENLRKARRNFRSTEQSIEEFLLEDHHRQIRRKENSDSIEEYNIKSSPEERVASVVDSNKKDIGETQPEKRFHGNGKRNKERTSRFSDKGATSTYFVQPHHSTTASTSVLTPQSFLENPLFNAKVASPTRKRKSYSSDEDRRSNSSISSSKHSYKSGKSSSHRHKKSSRHSDDDSDEYYSSRHSKKYRHKRKKSRSRSRSKSRSKSSYSSSSSSKKHR